MELFDMTLLWSWLFEIAHNWMKLLQIAKFDLAVESYPNVSNLCKCFECHPNLHKTFLICPDLIEAVGPYPNTPNLSNVSDFTQNLNESF